MIQTRYRQGPDIVQVQSRHSWARFRPASVIVQSRSRHDSNTVQTLSDIVRHYPDAFQTRKTRSSHGSGTVQTRHRHGPETVQTRSRHGKTRLVTVVFGFGLFPGLVLSLFVQFDGHRTNPATSRGLPNTIYTTVQNTARHG